MARTCHVPEDSSLSIVPRAPSTAGIAPRTFQPLPPLACSPTHPESDPPSLALTRAAAPPHPCSSKTHPHSYPRQTHGPPAIHHSPPSHLPLFPPAYPPPLPPCSRSLQQTQSPASPASAVALPAAKYPRSV